MKIGVKLNLAFFGIIVLLLISTFISVLNLNSIEEKSEEALNYRVVQIRLADEIRVNIGMQGLYAREMLLEQTAIMQEVSNVALALTNNATILRDEANRFNV